MAGWRWYRLDRRSPPRTGSMSLSGPGGGRYQILIYWDDWGVDPSRPAATLDINAYLYGYEGGGTAKLVGESVREQRGLGAPRELLAGSVPDPDATYILRLHAPRGTRRVRIHVHAGS